MLGNDHTLYIKDLRNGDIFCVNFDYILVFVDSSRTETEKLLFAPDVRSTYNDKILHAVKNNIEFTIAYDDITSIIHCVIIDDVPYLSAGTFQTSFGWAIANQKTGLIRQT